MAYSNSSAVASFSGTPPSGRTSTIGRMKTVVLDSNELARDFALVSLRYQLLTHTIGRPWFKVTVPEVVVEETIANYDRAMRKVRDGVDLPGRERRRLGLHVFGPLSTAAYRDYLIERFDERLGIDVLTWPEISHEELVRRAVNRIPPFNSNGGGYRDSLVWANVLDLARRGHEVVLVSSDKAFAGDDGRLKTALRAELAELDGSVELVRELAPWLLESFHWAADTMPEAVRAEQDRELFDYFLQSDLQTELEPAVTDLGFDQCPYSVTFEDVQWDGSFERVAGKTGPDGMFVASYELDFTAFVSASFHSLDVRDMSWASQSRRMLGHTVFEGQIPMILRMNVLFGGDFVFSIEELSWRRSDGTGRGADVFKPETNPDQLPLFEVPALVGHAESTQHVLLYPGLDYLPWLRGK